MYLLLVTVPYGEDLLLKDLEKFSFIKNKEKVGLGRVIVKIKNEEEAFILTYFLRSINRSILLLKKGEFEEENKVKLEDLANSLNEIDFDFLKEKKFAVRSERIGNHDFNRMQIMAKIGEEILKKVNAKVDLKNPDFIIRYDLIKNKYYLGIDLVGEKSLIKKKYKIKQHHAALNSVLAYLLIIFSEFENKTLLDPMCGSGTILFEALFKEIELPGGFFRDDLAIFKLYNFLDLKREIDEKAISKLEELEIKFYGFDRSKKSIEITKENLNYISKKLKFDLNKIFEIKKLSLDWLDWKFKEKEIDYIITNPPYGIRIGNPKKVESTYKELFYQSSYISNNLVLITTLENYVKKYSKEFNLRLKKVKPIYNQKLLTKMFWLK